MAKIETLVKDIYDVVSKQKISPARIASLGEAVSLRISSKMSSERERPTLRMSNLGMPDRKLWYTINQPEASEPLPPPARLKFLFGDILEELLLFLAREAGHDVTREQEEVDIDGVKGHIDAFIDGVLVDCKSASTYSFNKFLDHGLKGNDPFGYLDQLGAYAYASSTDGGAFLVIDKTLGNICLDHYWEQGVDYHEVVAKKRKMLSSREPPGRCYPDEKHQESGNRKLGISCSYCSFKQECHPGLRTFVYSGKPLFLTKVVREPGPKYEVL